MKKILNFYILYSLLSVSLQQMRATVEITEQPLLAIDLDYNSISFPFTKDEGASWFEGTLKLENFLHACSDQGSYLKQKLEELTNDYKLTDYFGGTFKIREPNSQEKFFTKFLEVILSFSFCKPKYI